MKNGTSSPPGDRRRTSVARSGKKSRRKAIELATSWRKVRSLSDEQVAASIAEDPDARPTDAKFWRGAKLVLPRSKKIVTMRLDADLLDWFHAYRGYETSINAILRAYVNAQVRHG